MRAIITGATGAVGHALIEELVNNNIEVLVFIRRDSKRNASIPKHKLVNTIECSLEQLKDIKNESGKKYDVFYHLAWNGTTGAARNDMYLQNLNVKYSLDAVEVAKRFGCDTFIGAGSQAEYGRVDGVLKTNTPAFPENGYGIGKLCSCQMTREYARQLEIKHIWVRILSVYGPYDGKQSMVMSTIDKLKQGIVPEFTKGEQMWDYLYSKDAAEAFRLLAEKGHGGKVYVLGSGRVRPLSEYIYDIKECVNPFCEVAMGIIPYSEKQVMHLEADISELQADTGFTPKTIFVDGIRETLKWSNTL